MQRTEFTGHDGKKISLVIWDDVSSPAGVIQISHGMAEHAMRYDGFAKEMNERGFIVAADDHRAHGDTDGETLGYSDGDIWENTLADLNGISKMLKQKYNLPLVLFGHSYGSFLTQAYIQRYSENLNAAIIGGSCRLKTSLVNFGKLAADVGCLFKGKTAPAKFLAKNTFDAYNKKYSDGTTFISSIKSECERYSKDEKCDFICSYNFYRSFFGGAKKLYKKSNAAGINKDLPVLLVAGDGDPVGYYGEGVKNLQKFYKDNGVKNVELKLYGGVRHEYLNDVSRGAVISDVYDFVLKNVKR